MIQIMFWVSLRRSFLFALQSFWRNIWLSLATIFVIFLAMVSVNFLIALNALSDAAVRSVQDRIDVTVFFKQDTKESKIAEIKSRLETLASVKDIVYRSPAENLEIFKQRHAGDENIQETLQELSDNPLGATLIIRSKSLDGYPEILKAVDNPAYADLIEEKSYDDNQTVIARINTIAGGLKSGGLIISLIFVVIAVLIIYNTVRIAIFTHQNEISIMKLVGAGNWFVRAPFIIESILTGILACLFSTAAVFPLFFLAQPTLSGFFGSAIDLAGYFTAHAPVIFGGQILAIVLINVISSSLAIHRYLKV